MLTDSIASEVLLDLTCTEENLTDDNIMLFQEDKENFHPIYLNEHFDDPEDKENLENAMPFFEHIEAMPTLRAGRDLKLLEDSRVLQNLLSAEDNFTSYPSTYKFQEDLTPQMRRTVAQWMLDVSWQRFCGLAFMT